MFTLGRKIDIHYKTNKVILVFALIITALGYLVTVDIKSSLYIGASIFMSWALTREIDPKHEYSAFAAASLSVINLFYFRKIEILSFFWILLTIRLINGITGKKITNLDIFLVFILTTFLTISNKNGVYFIPFMISTILLIKEKIKFRANWVFTVLALIIFIAESFFLEYYYIKNLQNITAFTAASIMVPIIYIFIKKLININGVLDDKGGQANKKRVRNSQTFYGITILILVLFSEISVNTVITYLSVIIGIILYSVFVKSFEKLKKY